MIPFVWPPPLVVKKKKGRNEWWILGLPSKDVPMAGPYNTREEADEDMRGLLRTYIANEDLFRKYHRDDQRSAEGAPVPTRGCPQD